MLRNTKIGPRKLSKYVRQHDQYVLSKLEYDTLFPALVKHFSGYKNVVDPMIRAEVIIRRVCDATLDSGKTWVRAPKSLSDRLKVFGFDYEHMCSIPGYMEKMNNIGVKATPMGLVPPEMQVAKGADPVHSSSLLSSEELDQVNKQFKKLVKDFPELGGNSTDQSTLMLLAKLFCISNRVMDNGISTGKLSKQANMDGVIVQNIERVQKLLGIDRPSREKQKSITEDGSVATLVVDYENYMDKEYVANELRWTLEELALLLRKHDRETPHGKEIDEIVFERLSGGISVSMARKIIKNPYYKSVEELMAEVQKDKLVRDQDLSILSEDLRHEFLSKRVAQRDKLKVNLRAAGVPKDYLKALIPKIKYKTRRKPGAECQT